MFDANTFLDLQFNESFSTEYPVCPAGEYNAVIADVKLNQFTRADQSVAYVLDVMHDVQGYEGPHIRQGVFLDTTPDGQGLVNGPGKNVQLGLIREAVGQNVTGQPWSPRMLVGRTVRVRVGHEPSKKNPQQLFNRIEQVSPVSGAGAVGQVGGGVAVNMGQTAQPHPPSQPVLQPAVSAAAQPQPNIMPPDPVQQSPAPAPAPQTAQPVAPVQPAVSAAAPVTPAVVVGG